ncbi:demethylmenaquinone methyltransferase/2-methoxy-6-polyprenyl-1,4-benzoquinol methylase [Leucobacter exalbidus]|uniref:Demethylmenaquinone methyltransferase n=1 Tax=Leucobacter exalbidus TaxID=662960 RepID=A0A940PU43_9MICO|nr:demethylmenaquinone methyltransferase/2-methoxy-6-polyprenyl-1,4-benzoquinol methylase [Leucobacter exalbidus]
MTRPDTSTKHADEVSAMFDEVSPRYDLINDVLTVGNDRLWRIATTKAVGPRKGMRILDLAAGTGTSSAALAAHGAHVVAADFSEGMLAEGRKRQAGNDLIEFVWADATQLPFEDNSFDAATISYGLRNVNDPRKAIAEMRRVVKPGGRVVIAEFSTPPSSAIRAPYAWYGKHVLPRIAGAINREAAAAYSYLNESIEAWPSQDELASWLRDAGLERVAYRNLTFGIVALHRGFVPREPVVVTAADTAAAKPAEQKPAAKKPAAKKPAAAAKPAVAKKPAAKKPATLKPAAAKPAASAKPAAAKPAATAKPAAAAKPVAPKPAAAKPAATDTPAKPAAQPTTTGDVQ